ncbi:MAG: MFS transporter [Thermomicrobiales bacterium]|nr:MFS transporter [Thermomicrobiales bacterium]
MPYGLRAFDHRDYRIFWFSQLISLTGTWMQTLAESWLVLTLTNSPLHLGFIAVCQFAPTLVLGLPGGVIADRFPKRSLLIGTQSAYFVLIGSLATLVATGRVQLWNIYAVALAFGIVTAIDMPTRQAFVVDLVGRDDVMNAVALNSALFNTSRVIGPAVAGLLLSTVGIAVCYILNAVSYLPVIAALLLMRTKGLPHPEAGDSRPVERLRQGLAYARATPAVMVPIVLVGLVSMFGMNFNVWVPLLAKDEFGIGAGGFGVLLSSLGVGSLAGALTLAFVGRRPDRRRMLLVAGAFGVFEVTLAGVAHVRAPLAAAMALMAAIGFSMSTATALANTTVQTTAPDHLRGRVMSIYTTVFAGATPFGAAIVGATASLFGAPAAIAIGGSVVVLAVVAIAIWSRRIAPTTGVIEAAAPLEPVGGIAPRHGKR